MIFKLLDRADSTCLGLTSKVLYNVHFGLHGKVPLSAYRLAPPAFHADNHLSNILDE